MRPSYQPRVPDAPLLLPHIYIPQSRTSACGGFHREGLTDSRGSHASGLTACHRTLGLPSTCAPIIADCDPLVKGFSEIFSDFFVPSFQFPTSPMGLGRPDPTLVGYCYPPFLGGGSQTHRLPTFRAIAPCSGGQSVPLGIPSLRWSYCITLQRVCQGFFEDFYGILSPYSGDLPPQGVYFATMASPCSATVGVPQRGWGSHPLLTLLLYHTIGLVSIGF